MFNADQIDGLPAYFYAAPLIEAPISLSERQAEIDAFVDPIPADVRHGGNEAFFSPTSD